MERNTKVALIAVITVCFIFGIYNVVTHVNNVNAETAKEQAHEDKWDSVTLDSCWFDFGVKTIKGLDDMYQPNYMPSQKCLEAMTKPKTTGNHETDKQYELAYNRIGEYFNIRKSGTQFGRCIQARRVAEAFLEIPDMDEYDDWVNIQEKDCK